MSPLLELLAQVAEVPGATNVTVKSNGRVAVLRDGALTVTQIDAIKETWMTDVAQLLPSRPIERRGAYTTVIRASTRLRFRATLSPEWEGEALAIRLLPPQAPSPETLGLPGELADYFSRLPSGLFLVAGPSGAGKTSTMMALLQRRAATVGGKFVTIEQPIEFQHEDTATAVFHQREVGEHTSSWESGIRDAVAERAQVILVQEAGSQPAARAALEAAAAGCVVITSVLAMHAVEAIQRFAQSVAASREETGALALVASCLEGAMAQRLISGPHGLVPVFDLLCVRNPRAERSAQIERLLRHGDWQGLRQELELARRPGMLSMEESIRQRQDAGLIIG